MTLQEKRKICKEYCDSNGCCDCCVLDGDRNAWCENYNTSNAPVELLDHAVNKILALKKAKDSEKVDHPAHYNAEGAMECIDEMVLLFGREATMHFCLCNAWKYRYRSNEKNGQEDMDKANWYIAKYKELKEGITNE